MKRTRLADRKLPDYTKGEEIMNMVTHIVGGAFGIVALVLCIVFSAFKKDGFLITGSAIYGVSLILLYTMSSVYHGLNKNMGKKVLQVIDHCTIYVLIGGTYTVLAIGKIREVSPVWGWGLFGFVWLFCILAAVFTAIDLKKYVVLSMICYIGLGWCVVACYKVVLQALTLPGFILLLLGGVSYTVGAVLYGIGVKVRYMHSVFHLFVLLGSILQFFAVLFYGIGV